MYICNVFFIVLDLRLTKDWLSIGELFENFVADLIYGTHTNGSDERMYIENKQLFYDSKTILQELIQGRHEQLL